jgi:hypothetical protein
VLQKQRNNGGTEGRIDAKGKKGMKERKGKETDNIRSVAFFNADHVCD